jgi:hypothetical protein
MDPSQELANSTCANEAVNLTNLDRFLGFRNEFLSYISLGVLFSINISAHMPPHLSRSNFLSRLFQELLLSNL